MEPFKITNLEAYPMLIKLQSLNSLENINKVVYNIDFQEMEAYKYVRHKLCLVKLFWSVNCTSYRNLFLVRIAKIRLGILL